jgi:hypothetical protein
MEIVNLIRAFFTSPGPGGGVVLSVLFLACTVYFLLTRWILAGGEGEEPGCEAPEG